MNPGGRECREKLRWSFEQRAFERDRKGSARDFSRAKPGVDPATRTKRLEIIRISSLLRFLSRFCRPLGFFTEMEVTKRPLAIVTTIIYLCKKWPHPLMMGVV